MRAVVTEPMVKGEVSTRLTPLLDEPYLRDCRACDAVHAWEVVVPARRALYGGLELEPGTSPPVLRRIPGWPRRRPGPGRRPAGGAGAAAAYPQLPAVPGPGDPARTWRPSWTRRWPRSRSTGRPTPSRSTVEGEQRWWLGALGHRVRPRSGPAAGWLRPAAAGPGPGADRAGHEPAQGTLAGPGPSGRGAGRDRDRRHLAARRQPDRSSPCGWSRGPKISKAVRGRLEAEAERLAAHRGLTLAGIEQQ